MRRKVAGLGLDIKAMGFALAYGPAVRSTLRQAQKMRAELFVAGKQGRSTMGGFLLGSVSSRVLSGSDCDMLIVPRPREEPLPLLAPTQAPWLESQAQADSAACTPCGAVPAQAVTPQPGPATSCFAARAAW